MKIENLTPIEIAFLYRLHTESVQCGLTEEDVLYAAKCHWPMSCKEITETEGKAYKREFGKYEMPTFERVRELFDYYLRVFGKKLDMLEDELGLWEGII